MNKYQKALLAIKKIVIDERADGFYHPRTVADFYCGEVDILQELADNPPLKFEDLKEGMWVWDDKEKWYRKIVILFDPCQEYPKGSFKSWADSCETSLDFVEFEENRFYRREVQR